MSGDFPHSQLPPGGVQLPRSLPSGDMISRSVSAGGMQPTAPTQQQFTAAQQQQMMMARARAHQHHIQGSGQSAMMDRFMNQR